MLLQSLSFWTHFCKLQEIVRNVKLYDLLTREGAEMSRELTEQIFCIAGTSYRHAAKYYYRC